MLGKTLDQFITSPFAIDAHLLDDLDTCCPQVLKSMTSAPVDLGRR